MWIEHFICILNIFILALKILSLDWTFEPGSEHFYSCGMRHESGVSTNPLFENFYPLWETRSEGRSQAINSCNGDKICQHLNYKQYKWSVWQTSPAALQTQERRHHRPAHAEHGRSFNLHLGEPYGISPAAPQSQERHHHRPAHAEQGRSFNLHPGGAAWTFPRQQLSS